MILHKLYLEPQQFFDPIEFRKGINFIYAKKDSSSDEKSSLNGLGKSLIMNLIDYCLLSSESAHIKSAKENIDLTESSVVLEFKIGEEIFIIKRSLATPNQNILFGKQGEELSSYGNTPSDKKLSSILCDLLFKNEDYEGKYSDKWLRLLIPFFIKKQSSKSKVNFKDPIKYLDAGSSEMSLLPLHLMLMGFDNTLFYKNFEISSELKVKKPTLAEVKSLVIDSYKLKDISQAESEIDKLRVQISANEAKLQEFKLAEQYENIEEECNSLTVKIKELLYANHFDKKKITSYKESFSIGDDISTRKIHSTYKELNELLAGNIKKTLDEAIKFRREIAKSRKSFLDSEINSLETIVSERKQEISEFEEQRSKLFKFLDAKKAINDLSEAYLVLSDKRKRLGDIEGKIKTYRDLKREYAELDAESKSVYAEIEKFSEELRTQLTGFRAIFFQVHDAIYEENRDRANFGFDTNPDKDSKVNISIELPAGLSYGKNKARTLIYDLTVLFHAIQENIKCPRFLIHDGIFDGIDMTHLVALYKFLEEKAKTCDFQYIVTLNQEGTLKDGEFGEGAEELTSGKIETEAIKVLTPTKPLFGKNWD